MRKNKLTSILLICLIITLSLSFLTSNVRSASTINYVVNRDVIYNDNINYNTTFNVRNQTLLTDTYNATYSFTDDANGSNPAGWSVNEAGGTVNVISNVDNHSKIVEIDDTNGAQEVHLYQSFSAQNYGSIEFWLRTNDGASGDYTFIEVGNGYNPNDRVAGMYLGHGNNLVYLNSAGWQYATDGDNDIWYHIRFDFELTAGGYLGLAQYRWNFHANNESFTDLTMWSNEAQAVNIKLFTYGATITTSYIDAIGYSWDSFYNMTDNIIPYHQPLNSTEVEYDQFNLDSAGNQYALGNIAEDDYVNGWKLENNPLNDVDIIESSEAYDREIEIYQDTVHLRWFSKDLSITTDGYVNFSLVMTYLDMNNDGSHFWIEMLSTSTVEIAGMRLYYSGGNVLLQHLAEDRGSWITDYTLDDSPYLVREFTMIISESNVVYARYRDNSSVDYKYTFSKINSAPTFYDHAMFGSSMDDTSNTQTFHIDAVSISINGTTQNYVDDYSMYFTDLNITNWNTLHNNIVEINAVGSFSFGSYSDTGFSVLESNYNYTGSKVSNVYDVPINHSNPIFTIMTNDSITVSNVLIHGVKLIQATNEYWLEYTYGNIDINDNYFYATTGNLLRFILTCDDNNTEYIQATFNINDIVSENRSISFISDRNGGSNGYFAVDYDDSTSSIFDIEVYPLTQNIILPQDKTIDKFTILITDNDADDNDYTTGYVHGVSLIYYTDISITITTLSLVNALVPIIIMLVPTLAFAKKYGKNIIVPMIMVMSLICVASDLIPVWLFFVIMLSSGAFLFMKFKGADN